MKTQKALYYEALSIKQSCQLIALCREFQPHVPFDDVVFLELIAVARRFCDPGYFIFIDDLQNRFEKVLKPTVEIIKAKYYFNGFKSNKRSLNGIQFYYINNYVSINPERWAYDKINDGHGQRTDEIYKEINDLR